MTRCAISLGGNQGDVPATFAEALRRLESLPTTSAVRVSRLYRTAPMGADAGDTFWNAAITIENTAAPLDLLDSLQQIETSCGRVRRIPWGPRPLDLDLILFGDQIFETPRLTVPHPALWHRRFVLDPLVDLIPVALHPVFQVSIQHLRERLLRRPLPVGWVVPATSGSLRTMAGTAYPTNAVADDALDTAAILFAGRDTGISFPQVVRLPDDEAGARQLVTDVLTAACDEPIPVSWPQAAQAETRQSCR